MLTYDIDSIKDMPLYEGLYRFIQKDIVQGKIKVHEKLPSKRRLAAHLNISVTTVENAYGQLMTEGYIHSEQGRGFFVNEIGNMMGVMADEDQTERKMPYIPPEEEEEEYLVDFASNIADLSLFPFSTWSRLMRDILSGNNRELLKTVPYNGIYPLRKALADLLKSYRNMQVNPEQIIIGAGTEYLYGRILQLFGPGTVIALEEPGYKKLADLSQNREISWEYLSVYDKSHERMKKSKADIVHVSPANHFPTGIPMPVNVRMDLLEWAHARKGHYIIEDDYDSEIRYSGRAVPTLYTMDDKEKVIYLNTFSKSLIPSIRISYLILPPALLEKYRKTLSFYSCTSSSFEQLVLARFISEGYFERHINRLRMNYREKRDELLAAIEHSSLAERVKVSENNVGTHFQMKVVTQMSDEEIKRQAARHGMKLKMLSDYENIRQPENAGTLVINYAGVPKKRLKLAVQILESVFSK